MKARELRQKLGELTHQLRQILDAAEKDGRPKLNADEESRYTAIEADITSLEAQIQRVETQEAREARLSETLNPHDAGREGRTASAPAAAPGNPAIEIRDLPPRFESLGRRLAALPEAVRAAFGRRASEEYRAGFRGFLQNGFSAMPATEMRALQADADISGGTLVAPVQFVASLLKFVDDMVFVRQRATIFPAVSAQSLGVPSLDADPADSDWTSELGTGTEDSTMATGKRELKPHPLAKRIKVSNKLLRISAIDAEDLVRARLGYKFGVTQEKAFLTGTGANQPLGMFVASADGIPTSRDVNTGSATDITADGVIDALYNLKEQYQRTAEWLLSREIVKRIRKLKGSDNNYLWQPGLQGGQPSTILDRPFHMSEYVPATFTSGLYVGLVGDLSFYWIADSLEMTVQRLVELYAETNQTGFIGRLETDGAPVLAEAFSRMKTN